jgi:hypothetical protein
VAALFVEEAFEGTVGKFNPPTRKQYCKRSTVIFTDNESRIWKIKLNVEGW